MYSIHAHAVTVRALSCQTLCSYLFFLHFVIMLQLKNVKVFYNRQLRGLCDLGVDPTFTIWEIAWAVITNTQIANEMFKGDDLLNVETALLYANVEECSNGEPVKNDRQIGTLPEESLRNIALHFGIRPDASTFDPDVEAARNQLTQEGGTMAYVNLNDG